MEKTEVSLKDLELIYANNRLTEYLTTLSTDELSTIKSHILCDDIIGVRIGLLSAIEDAIEYRFLEQFISLKDAEFLSEEFDLQLTPANYSEMKNSFEYLEAYGDFQAIIRWCPSLLYLNRSYRVFAFLKNNGKSDEEIASFFCSSFDRVMKLSDSLKDAGFTPAMSRDFHKLIETIVFKVERNKAQTESYKKYTNQMFKQNADLLKRLS